MQVHDQHLNLQVLILPLINHPDMSLPPFLYDLPALSNDL